VYRNTAFRHRRFCAGAAQFYTACPDHSAGCPRRDAGACPAANVDRHRSARPASAGYWAVVAGGVTGILAAIPCRAWAAAATPDMVTCDFAYVDLLHCGKSERLQRLFDERMVKRVAQMGAGAGADPHVPRPRFG